MKTKHNSYGYDTSNFIKVKFPTIVSTRVLQEVSIIVMIAKTGELIVMNINMYISEEEISKITEEHSLEPDCVIIGVL